MVSLFVRDKKHMTRSLHGADIYRVYQNIKGDESNIIATAPPAFATALKQNYPEVEQEVRVMNLSTKKLFEANQKKFYEGNGFVPDSNFFSLFPLKLKFGSPFKVFTQVHLFIFIQTHDGEMN